MLPAPPYPIANSPTILRPKNTNNEFKTHCPIMEEEANGAPGSPAVSPLVRRASTNDTFVSDARMPRGSTATVATTQTVETTQTLLDGLESDLGQAVERAGAMLNEGRRRSLLHAQRRTIFDEVEAGDAAAGSLPRERQMSNLSGTETDDSDFSTDELSSTNSEMEGGEYGTRDSKMAASDTKARAAWLSELRRAVQVTRRFQFRESFPQRSWHKGEREALLKRSIAATRAVVAKPKDNWVRTLQIRWRRRAAAKDVATWGKIRDKLREAMQSRNAIMIDKASILMALLPRGVCGLERRQIQAFQHILAEEVVLKRKLTKLLLKEIETHHRELQEAVEVCDSIGYVEDLVPMLNTYDAKSVSEKWNGMTQLYDPALAQLALVTRRHAEVSSERRSIRTLLHRGILARSVKQVQDALQKCDELAEVEYDTMFSLDGTQAYQFDAKTAIPGYTAIGRFALEPKKFDAAIAMIRQAKEEHVVHGKLLDELRAPRVNAFRPGIFPPVDADSLHVLMEEAKSTLLLRADRAQPLAALCTFVRELRECLSEALQTRRQDKWAVVASMIQRLNTVKGVDAPEGFERQGKGNCAIHDPVKLPDIAAARALLVEKAGLDRVRDRTVGALAENDAVRLYKCVAESRKISKLSLVPLVEALYPEISKARYINLRRVFGVYVDEAVTNARALMVDYASQEHCVCD